MKLKMSTARGFQSSILLNLGQHRKLGLLPEDKLKFYSFTTRKSPKISLK